MYQTELHLHSRDASPCARASAKHIVEKYSNAGYNTIVVTNHFNQELMEAYGCESWESYVDMNVQAYEKIKNYAQNKLNVLLGAEIRYSDSDNDYLVYGLTPEYLYANSDVFLGDYVTGLTAIREAGMLVYQAHPFRLNMKIIPPQLVNGYEAFNGSPGHASSNDMAYHWANRLKKPKISGTDHHNPGHRPNGGIMTEEEIRTNDDLLRILKSQQYLLITAMLEHEMPTMPPLEYMKKKPGESPFPPGMHIPREFPGEDD